MLIKDPHVIACVGLIVRGNFDAAKGLGGGWLLQNGMLPVQIYAIADSKLEDTINLNATWFF